MGLSNHLADVSSDSIPILILISAAKSVSYIRYLFFCLLHSVAGFGLSHHPAADPSPQAAAVGSGLAGLVVLADHLATSRPFAAGGGPGGEGDGCVFCLENLREGERVRRLQCCHVFHSECLDGWLFGGDMHLSCPLCRAPLEAEERRADTERRIGAELVAWLSPY